MGGWIALTVEKTRLKTTGSLLGLNVQLDFTTNLKPSKPQDPSSGKLEPCLAQILPGPNITKRET
jgi:hypothetical protein